jgi:hypothetical protein
MDFRLGVTAFALMSLQAGTACGYSQKCTSLGTWPWLTTWTLNARLHATTRMISMMERERLNKPQQIT